MVKVLLCIVLWENAYTAGCEKYDINSNIRNDGLNMDHLNFYTYETV